MRKRLSIISSTGAKSVNHQGVGGGTEKADFSGSELSALLSGLGREATDWVFYAYGCRSESKTVSRLVSIVAKAITIRHVKIELQAACRIVRMVFGELSSLPCKRCGGDGCEHCCYTGTAQLSNRKRAEFLEIPKSTYSQKKVVFESAISDIRLIVSNWEDAASKTIRKNSM
ncbi:hypothetical protein [Photobacterium indicum]|uniref:hypothetical protein n=1 Tax=Photobacterium indicum TaxID=81447 RepID=UPI003D09A1BA